MQGIVVVLNNLRWLFFMKICSIITTLLGRSPWSPSWTLTPTSTTGSTWTRTRSLSRPGLRGDSSFLPQMALLSAILFQVSSHRWLCYQPSYFKKPPHMALLSAILFQNSDKDGSAINNFVSKFRYRRLCYQQSFSKFSHWWLCYQQSYYKIPPTDGPAITHPI